MEYVIYLEHNGEILRNFSGPMQDLVLNLAIGEAALPGTSSWVTHKVIDGEFIPHRRQRQPPFEHASWDPKLGTWFDPMDIPAHRPFEIARRREAIKQKIVEAEAALARPLRALAVAWSSDRAPDSVDVEALELRDGQINALREELQRLPES